MINKLWGIFTGALIGYVWGWIWGWSLFDPNSDIWALAAFIGAIIGLVVGLLPLFWRLAAGLVSATIGLYSAWILRALLWGDTPGLASAIYLLVGMLLGRWLWKRFGAPQAGRKLWPLVWALYAGFIGGFLIDVVILDLLTGLVREHSILSQAPAVLICGVLGWFISGKVMRKETIET